MNKMQIVNEQIAILSKQQTAAIFGNNVPQSHKDYLQREITRMLDYRDTLES